MKKIPHLELFLAPAAVLVFAGLLSLMYGWVGEMTPLGRGIKDGPIRVAAADTAVPAVRGRGQGQSPGAAAPFIGFSLGDLTPDRRRAAGLAPDTGVEVLAVAAGSPAGQSGIVPGDILTAFNFKPVGSVARFSRCFNRHRPGEAVKTVLLTAGGREKSVYVKLAERPATLRQAGAQTPLDFSIGMGVQDVDAVMARQMDLPASGGVIVSHLDRGGAAAGAGVKRGDVIRRVNGKRITDTAGFKAAAGKKIKKGRELELAVVRNGRQITLAVRPAAGVGNMILPVIPQADMAVGGSWIGMEVSELAPGDAGKRGLPRGTRGMLVDNVEGPPANALGFRSGDCITAVNGTPTPAVSAFVKATRGQQGAVVDIVRGSHRMYISVPPPGFDTRGNLSAGPLTRVNAPGTLPAGGTVANVGVLTDGSSPYSSVAGDTRARYLIVFDGANNRYTGLPLGDGTDLGNAAAGYGIHTLIASDLGNRAGLNRKETYTGVTGPAVDAYQRYRAGLLTAAR
ncbi:MAG: PDZ domain-containing protein [Desulfobacterales bacterium]|nr:PDZ domain-containing protein [Desulfobacterales bacterium]